jgi:aspartyl protease family protein
MVDTGASFIALRASEADRLGYHPAPRDYTLRMSTANGEGRAAPIEIGMLEVDGIIVHDIKAIVVADNALGMNLLGMTFLSRVRWTHDRGRLVLEQ